MKHAPKLAFPTIAAVTLALALVGCGGGGRTSTSASMSGSTYAQGNVTQPNSTTNPSRGSSLAPTAKQPHTYAGATKPGSRAPAPDVPVSKGGDNSIQTWGLEATSAERIRVAAIVRAFLDARAAADWAKACSYLATEQIRMFEQLAQGKSCAVAMGGLAQGVPARAFDDEAKTVRVLSLRVGGGHAFLIYTRSDGKAYATALSREGAAWKVFSVGPTQLG